MKLLAICLLIVAPLGLFADTVQESPNAAQQAPGAQIPGAQVNGAQVSTDQLKSWYDQKVQMIVVDARSKDNFNGQLLPGAKWLPFNSSDDDIKAALPSKDALIVVYCCGPQCPASASCAQRLRSMGYSQVYEYHDGLDEWTRRGFPVDRQ